jgi:hypothetical protein
MCYVICAICGTKIRPGQKDSTGHDNAKNHNTMPPWHLLGRYDDDDDALSSCKALGTKPQSCAKKA